MSFFYKMTRVIGGKLENNAAKFHENQQKYEQETNVY